MKSTGIDRRTFLRGAGAAVGAGVLTKTGLAALAHSPAVSVAYVEGDRLVPGGRLSPAGAKLGRVSVRVEVVGAGPIQSLSIPFRVGRGAGAREVPFTAWASGGGQTQFEVSLHDGILSLNVSTVKGEAQQALGAGVPLREGTYLLAAGTVNWRHLRVEDDRLVAAGGGPTSLQYIRLTISRA